MCDCHWPAARQRAFPTEAPDFQVPLQPVDEVTITTLVDNATDALATDQGPAKRPPAHGVTTVANRVGVEGWGIDSLVAEHGFSTLVTVRAGEKVRRVLFDAGVSPTGMVENMRRLEVDPKAVDTVVLSHGHYDHVTGLDGFLQAVGGNAGLPLVVHPDLWLRRRLAVPGREPFEIPTPSRSALEGGGFSVIEGRQPSLLLDGRLLVTGEVPRVTTFELGLPTQQAWRGAAWQPDPMVADDQALVANVRGRGLVVLTGCGHAGIVNITRWALQLTGISKVCAVVGGFHLNGPLFSPAIPEVVGALSKLGPEVVLPAHCTGWPAQLALAGAMPNAFVQNTVGTTVTLSGRA